jgi:photosystem II stability/assembly factor-like uncharacterized protein
MKWHKLLIVSLWLLSACQIEHVLPLSLEKKLSVSEPIRDIGISPSSNSLWVIGGNTYTSGFVLKSDDGVTIDTLLTTGKALEQLIQRDSDSLLVIGYDGLRYVSFDQGITWEGANDPSYAPLQAGQWFSNKRFVAVAGEGYNRGSCHTADSLWFLWDSTQQNVALYDLGWEASSGHLIAVGAGGGLLSQDLGKTWEAIPIQGDVFIDIECQEGQCLILGFSGQRYIYNGQSFARVNGGMSKGITGIRSMSCSDDGNCLAVGDNGLCLWTRDFGNTWITMEIPTAQWSVVQHTESTHTFYLGNQEGEVYRLFLP